MAISTPAGAGTPLPSESTAPPEPPILSAGVPEDPAHPVVLTIKDLKTYFYTYDGVVKALDGVSLQIRAGETTGLVGETGCGKSVTAFSVTRLIADPPGRIMSGEVRFRGANLLWNLDKEAKFVPIKGTGRVKVKRSFRRIKESSERMSSVRGRAIATIFQEPTQAMNPVFSISNQLSEVLLLHRGHKIIGEMLMVTPKAPEVPEAIDALLQAAAAGKREEMRAAANHLGDVTHSQAFGTEAFYIARTAGANALEAGPQVRRALRRLERFAFVGNPNPPGFQDAIKAMQTAVAEKNEAAMRAAASRLGTAARSGAYGKAALKIALASPPDAPALEAELRAEYEARSSSGTRRFLLHRRRMLQFEEELRATRFREMLEEKHFRSERRRIARRRTRERISHFYYGIRGIRARAEKPLNDELFFRVVRELEGVSIANPVQVARGYPHELSGGMLQRVMIAMALSAEPELLIADEPTTALDVTIQAQILDLMRDLKTRVGTAILLITHDLSVIAEVADRVCVMYAGVIIEQGPVHEIFRRPLHPYAQGLLASIPRLDQPDKQLTSIPGSVPDLIHPPTGCRFHPRCPYAMPVCKEQRPPMTIEGPGHTVACYLYRGPVAAE